MDYRGNVRRNENPREKANLMSLITFLYTRRLFFRGFIQDLEEDDIYEVIKTCKSKNCGDSILEPEAISKLVGYFKPGQTHLTTHDAIVWTGVMIGLKLLHCLYFQNYLIYINQLAIQIRTAYCSLIYRKSLKLSPAALEKVSSGNIVTVITKDVLQLETSIWLFNDLWIAFIQTIVLCYLIYNRIGMPSLVGIMFLIGAIPIQVFIGNRIKNLRMKMNKRTDERLQVTQEMLSTIKIIKMYTWETFFAGKIDVARRKELKILMKNYLLKIVLIISSLFVANIGFYALIMMYIWMNTNISAEDIFYIMRVYSMLKYAVALNVSVGSTKMAELVASFNRIDAIIKQEELPVELEIHEEKPEIDLTNVSLRLGGKQILRRVNIKAVTGLTVITGQLGSGKSSLIKIILKDYLIDEGKLNIKGTRSYASQDPWLFPSSIKQNILFGQKYDYRRYQTVVEVCALKYDFSILKNGDETIVTDRGLNLSRGQQARINLARAIYKESDIYLIDDALSALDIRVQTQIFRDCIKGFLKDKLVILVTHNKKHIQSADELVVLENGTVKFNGDQQDLSEDLIRVLEHEDPNMELENADDNSLNDEKTRLLDDLIGVEKKQVYFESKKAGGVDFGVYKKYMKYGGGVFFLIFIFTMFIASTLSESSSTKMLSNWVNQKTVISAIEDEGDYTISNLSTQGSIILDGSNNITQTTDLLKKTWVDSKKLENEAAGTLNMYSILMVATMLLELLKFYLVMKFAANASIRIHNDMMQNLVNSVMGFFDNCFIGNILNRFSQDLSVIDEHLALALSSLFGISFALFGTIGLIASVNWKFIYPSIALLAVLVVLRMIYIPTSRSLKRLEAATRSPLVGHLNSSIEGLTTIRAFRAQNILRDEFDRHQDLYTSAHYTSMCSRTAFSFYMDFSACLYISFIISRFLLFEIDTAAGDVGLTITQAGSLSMVVQMAMMVWSEVENLMTSVERVLEYTNLNPEEKTGLEISEWPHKGEINYVNVNLSYEENDEKVLKNINFTVKSKQKIGIIGRTGAGKSSIISTLFRLYNFDGQIYIDDVETKTLSLTFLRRHISIIPQDPITFSGTVRQNIDPLDEFTDDDIWKTIQKLNLNNIIPNLEMRLEDTNLSSGEKQLICLARAIIHKNKIVVLDEATANMDPETEFLIQKTIVENFSACTVFIIAHRLQSILDCHKVMVLERGEIVEYEDPLILMNDKDSMFSQMLRNAGIEH
ncbi:unnamed protein product [Phaedon cochleariae]|uniref:Multidrug resistance-associated protein lethal(2)03659 n=1 Tax=Phaedon cochleariae TaxID=80249 RepID=A0A9N9X267_PHACE|nr:unnamed protein product [Phaedon cochleariae]